MEKKKFKDFQFELFNTVWAVEFKDKGETTGDGGELLGKSVGATNTIWVATHDAEGNTLPERQIILIMLHEIVHAIFETGQYLSCNSDEPLIEWVARSIYSLINQDALEYARQ